MFHYVYILVSGTDPARHYVGSTRDLQARLAAHNAVKVRHTATQAMAHGNGGGLSL